MRSRTNSSPIPACPGLVEYCEWKIFSATLSAIPTPVSAAEAPAFEQCGVELGVATVRAEAAVVWLGADRLDKVVATLWKLTR